jgi:hypothetical protein
VNVYDVVLFIHLLGVATLFAAIGILQLAGFRLRGATTVHQARLWVGVTSVTGSMFSVALVIILGAGLYMASDRWSFGTSWIVMAIISVVVLGAVGGAGIGRSLEALGRALAQADGPQIPPGVARRIRSPRLWSQSFALMTIAIGVLWLMTNKPGWGGAVGVIVGLAIVGAAAGAAVARRAGRPDAS